jgi:hypothetical protein
MTKLQCQCCLCGKAITRNTVDPCAIVLIGNWAGPESEQAGQQFFCHVDCFKRAVWSNVPVEIEGLVADKLDGSEPQ